MRIVCMTNDAQLPMMKNMLNSAMKSGWDMSLFHCYILRSQKEAATYGTQEFKSITIRKLEVIYQNMKLDTEILWIDNDIYLFENCLSNIRSKQGHFVMQDDLWSPCTGFFLARTNPMSLSKIQYAINWLKARIGQPVNDQHAFLTAVNKFPIVIPTLLDREEYPNGEIYFNQKKSLKARMVHSNYLMKTDEKVKRFKEHELWDESDIGFEMATKYYI